MRFNLKTVRTTRRVGKGREQDSDYGRARDGKREAKKQGGERDKKPKKENCRMRFSAVPQPEIDQEDNKTIIMTG